MTEAEVFPHVKLAMAWIAILHPSIFKSLKSAILSSNDEEEMELLVNRLGSTDPRGQELATYVRDLMLESEYDVEVGLDLECILRTCNLMPTCLLEHKGPLWLRADKDQPWVLTENPMGEQGILEPNLWDMHVYADALKSGPAVRIVGIFPSIVGHLKVSEAQVCQQIMWSYARKGIEGAKATHAGREKGDKGLQWALYLTSLWWEGEDSDNSFDKFKPVLQYL